MRYAPLFAIALFSLAACADAPITAADIQGDGQLRERPNREQSVLAASETRRPQPQKAQTLAVTGVLAAQHEGALEDATRFSTEFEAIHLHLRANEIERPVP